MKRSSLLTICLAFCLPVALTTFAFAQDAGAAAKGPLKAIQKIPCVVVCFGPSGPSRWEDWEIRQVLERLVRGCANVIPVQHPGSTPPPNGLLQTQQWINFDQDWERGFAHLIRRIDAGVAP